MGDIIENWGHANNSTYTGLERRVCEKQEPPFTLLHLFMISVSIAICYAITIPGTRKYWPFSESKREYVINYESPQVRQLCDSALKNVAPVQRSARLYEVDADKNGVITESELFKYVRENYAKLK